MSLFRFEFEFVVAWDDSVMRLIGCVADFLLQWNTCSHVCDGGLRTSFVYGVIMMDVGSSLQLLRG